MLNVPTPLQPKGRDFAVEVSLNRFRETFKGLSYYVPGFPGLVKKLKGLRASKASARYCYSVWLRHLVAMHQNGLNPKWNVVMEIGPGDSIGVGLSALLSGAERYLALDAVRHTNVADNLSVLDDLVELFDCQAPIPDDAEFPDVKPKLATYTFPDYLIGVKMGSDRVQKIRDAICDSDADDSCITYLAPYHNTDIDEEGFVDLVISQAVLEHIDDLEAIYRIAYRWLRPEGFVSHQIDYRCHGTSSRWNGHWTYSDLAWKLIRGKRPYLLNREPHSTHLRLLEKYGYEIRAEIRVTTPSPLRRAELANRFKACSEDDLITSGALIQAQKVERTPHIH